MPTATPTTGTPAAVFDGERALLVEDNTLTRVLGAQMLASLGLSVETAEDGEEALARVGAFDPTVVLMDVQLPGIDGCEATRRLRHDDAARGRARRIVIAVTAHAEAAEHERCHAAGMDACVVKPYTVQQLADELARWLPGEAVLDDARLSEVRLVMGAAYVALLREAADLVEQQLQQVVALTSAGDASAAAAAAHKLKNTAGDVGARALHRAASGTEQALRRGAPEDARLAELQHAARRAAAALRTAD